MSAEKLDPKKIILSFKGMADETLLSFLLRQIESSGSVPAKLKTRICLLTVELINNVITHHSDSPYCVFLIKKMKSSIELYCGNFSTEKKINFIRERIEQAKKVKNLSDFYYGLLKNTRPGISRKLGLVRMYKNCDGRMYIKTQRSDNKTFITLQLKISL
jgi:hypothetical protein